MERNRGYVFVLGVLTGVAVAGVIAFQAAREPQGCEPVVDVEYKRVGKEFIPDTVVRQPVRDAGRCVLAEAGA